VDVGLLIARLKAAYPTAECALHHENPFQLLVATILSAQCTDERVNMVTPVLFAAYPDPAAMKDADPASLEEIIKSTGFYRNKTRSIRGAAQRLVETYGGTVPSTMEELLTLPGVARKTANVVLGVGYGVSEGVVVDTHVYRLSRRLGLTKSKKVEDVEQDLMAAVPPEEWIHFAHLLIFHGRRVCIARKPRCGVCPVQDLCPSAAIFMAGKIPAWERARQPKKKAPAKRPKPRKKTAARRKAGRR
jgi:endonuclease III